MNFLHLRGVRSQLANNTVSTGQPNSGGTGIRDGTTTTTVLDAYGQTVSVTVTDILSTAILQRDIYTGFDSLDRATQLNHLDGTSNLYSYACCYLENSRTGTG